MTSCSSESDWKTNSEILAEKYNVTVKKFDQCVDVWGKSDELAYRSVAEYIGSKGIFGFFQPSCDGSIKEEFENYKTIYLSAPIYGATKGGQSNDRCASVEQFTMQHVTGQYGGQRGRSTTSVTCPTNAYQVGMAQESLERRKINSARNSYRSFRKQKNAGNAR